MPPDPRYLAVSLHDVAAATWPDCRRVLQAVAEVADIPLTLLVVPAYHGISSARADFEGVMSALAAAGHELALHGYFHTDSQLPDGWVDWVRRRIYTASEGEFAALSEREAAERLHLGRCWFTANNWPLTGFVAPAWLLGPGAWQALRNDGRFAYTTTLTRLHLLASGRAVPAPCLTYSVRSASRRALSIAWNALLQRTVATMPVVRFGLHPHDADDRAVKRSWQRHLEHLLRDRTAVTKAELARVLCQATDRASAVVVQTGTAAARPVVSG